MKSGDSYLLARAYAGEQFDGSDERFWIAVGAFIKGVEVGEMGVDVAVDGKRINRICFFFSGDDEREFTLKTPIMVVDRFAFLHQLRNLTGIKEVGIYE